MIVVMKKGVSKEIIEKTQKTIESLGLIAHVSEGKERVVIGAVGSDAAQYRDQLSMLKGVEEIIRIQKPYKFVSREFQEHDTILEIGSEKIGGKNIQIIAGPCTVENKDDLFAIAHAVKASGAKFLRGGAFKPRTSPYSFQGMGKEGLELLKQVREETGLLIVTELLDPRDAGLVAQYADVIQIGARNMQNFRLLLEVGKLNIPVLLKRGISATVHEWLMSAEYIASEGNRKIIFCERGIRTFETQTRNTLDISSVPVIKELSHLPVIVDPSHAAGKWNYVESLSRAAIAAGADGLMIEVHHKPETALCDGPQALRTECMQPLFKELKSIANIFNRDF